MPTIRLKKRPTMTLKKRPKLTAKKKPSLTPSKAGKILKDGEVRGKPLTKKQKKFFGLVSSGEVSKKRKK